ncbi:hypothetical protein Pst134EB_029541 [Puccinia striiformis f. sp. tritici]|nr:hypothetical protein Pst134EB_029541 [Puccinia striiformis f. sp. tritici]
MVIRKKHGSRISSIDPVKRNSTAVAVKPPQAPAGDMWTEDPSLIPIPAITTKTVTPIKPPSSLKPNKTQLKLSTLSLLPASWPSLFHILVRATINGGPIRYYTIFALYRVTYWLISGPSFGYLLLAGGRRYNTRIKPDNRIPGIFIGKPDTIRYYTISVYVSAHRCYNPTLSNHQDILQQTLEKLEVNKAAKIKQRVTKGLKLTQAIESPWDICEEALGDGESDDEQQSNTTKGSTPKSVAKKKTKAQHQRQENEQEQMQMLALRKEAKQVAHTLHKLPKLVQRLTTAEQEARQARIAQKAKQAALVAEYGLPALQGGKPKGLQAVEDQHKYQLTEDLTKSGLRGLKPEGNLWRDWSQSNTRRGKLDNRTKVGLVKGQRFQKG